MSEQATSLEALLVVGRRVRVSLSGECIPQQLPTSWAALEGATGHIQELNGRVGIILRTDYPFLPGHPFEVFFDGGFVVKGHRYMMESYAPSELIPLNDDGSKILHPMLARYER